MSAGGPIEHFSEQCILNLVLNNKIEAECLEEVKKVIDKFQESIFISDKNANDLSLSNMKENTEETIFLNSTESNIEIKQDLNSTNRYYIYNQFDFV